MAEFLSNNWLALLAISLIGPEVRTFTSERMSLRMGSVSPTEFMMSPISTGSVTVVISSPSRNSRRATRSPLRTVKGAPGSTSM